MSTPYVRFWYAIAVAFVACAVCAGAAMGYGIYVNGESRRRAEQAQTELARVQQEQRDALCRMVVLMDDAWHETPPSTTSGRNLAEAIADARATLGCPKR